MDTIKFDIELIKLQHVNSRYALPPPRVIQPHGLYSATMTATHYPATSPIPLCLAHTISSYACLWRL
jgi:hypothetical protein